MKLALIKDQSEKYDGYNWHEDYAKYCCSLNLDYSFIDFSQSNWNEQIITSNADCFLWRAWHVPWDKENAKRKIHFIEKTLKKNIFPTWDMYSSYDDKIEQFYLLDYYNFPHPVTFISHSYEETENYIKNIRYPIVSKASDGAMGDNVRLIENQSQLISHLNQVFSDNGLQTRYFGRNQQKYVYLQEFVPIEKDLRVITIGNKIELAFWRTSIEWKKNISNGGRIDCKNIPDMAIKLALEVSKKLNMHWCAYDMIINNGQVQILEFSSVFGFSTEQYLKVFGHKNARILEKQIEYIKHLYS